MNPKTVVGVVAVLAVLLVGAGVYYLNRPAAEEASVDNALEALEEGETGAPSDSAFPTAEETAPDGADATEPPTQVEETVTEDGAAPFEDASGTWAVDTTIGEFDFGDATSSFVGFRVDEELSTVGETEAVGRTAIVSGELGIDGTQLTTATVEADLTAMVSDIPRRDDAMRRAMNVSEHPTGTFTLTQPVDVGEVPAEGETVTFTAVGELTVNGTTNPVEIPLEAQVANGRLIVAGRAPVVFAEYDITAPQAGPVVTIADEGTVELQLWFSRA